MENIKLTIIGVIIIVAFGFATKQVCSYFGQIESLQAQLEEARNYVPTIEEIQQRLCNAGYVVKVDGIWGNETKAALNRYHCDKYAEKYFGE